MTYDYEAKGRADFGAGRKDEKLYGGGDRHHADSRRGWQQARRDAEGLAEGARSLRDVAPPAQTAEKAAPPTPDIPPWGVQAPPRPADGAHTTLARGVDQLAGTASEQAPAPKTAGSDPEQPLRAPPPVTRESVKLATGEDKPRKPKPAAPTAQLDLFA